MAEPGPETLRLEAAVERVAGQFARAASLDDCAAAWEQERAALRDASDTAIGKAFWVGHTCGRVIGKRAIKKGEIEYGSQQIQNLIDERNAIAASAPDDPAPKEGDESDPLTRSDVTWEELGRGFIEIEPKEG